MRLVKNSLFLPTAFSIMFFSVYFAGCVFWSILRYHVFYLLSNETLFNYQKNINRNCSGQELPVCSNDNVLRLIYGLQLPLEQKFEREKYQRLSGAGSGKAATYCFYVVFMWHDFLSFFLSLFFFYYIFFFSLFFVSLFIFRSVTMNKYLTLSSL